MCSVAILFVVAVILIVHCFHRLLRLHVIFGIVLSCSYSMMLLCWFAALALLFRYGSFAYVVSSTVVPVWFCVLAFEIAWF